MSWRKAARGGALLLLLALLQCTSEPTPATEVIVSVRSDLRPGVDLTRVEVSLYDEAGEHLAEQRPFQLAPDKGTPGTVTFPFSFGIAKGKAQRFRLVVTGSGPFGAGDEEIAVVEQKVMASFLTHESALLDIFLGQVCFRTRCSGDTTCFTASDAETPAGSCGPIPSRELAPVARGAEHAGYTPVDDTLDAGTDGQDAAEEAGEIPDDDAAQGDAADLGSDASDASTPVADASKSCLTPGAQPCDDGLFCNGTEACDPARSGADARGCVAGTPVSCSASEVCDESQDRCSSCAVDDDGDNDSARAKACGGNDCDDGDPARAPGRSEICDGKDNDCDDAIDGALASATCAAPVEGSASCVSAQCVPACRAGYTLSSDGLRCNDSCFGVTSCAPGTCMTAGASFGCMCPATFVGSGTKACACAAGDKLAAGGASCRTPTLGPAIQVASSTANPAPAWQLAGEANGSVFVAWVETFRTVFGKRKPKGGAWDALLPGSPTITTNAMRAVALPGGSGIAFYNGSEFDHSIGSQLYKSGTGWSSLTKHDVAGTIPNIENSSLAAASDGLGNAFFVWSARDAQNVQRLWYTRYTNSAFTPAALVVPVDSASPMASAGSSPRLVVDGMGRALLAFTNPSGAVWSEFINGSFAAPHAEGAPTLPVLNARGVGALLGQFGLRLYSFSSGVGPAQINVGNGSGDPAALGVDDAGNVLVVWAASANQLSYRRFDASTQTLSAVRMAPASAAIGVSALQLKVAPNGDALAVWSDTGAGKLWGQRYVAGVGFQAAVEFQANNGAAPGAPQIAIDKLGDAVVVWQQGPANQLSLWSSTLE